MKKRLTALVMCVAVCLSIVACGGETKREHNKDAFGDDSDAIYEVLDNYFDALEKCDYKKVNKCVGPEGVDNTKLVETKYEQVDFPNVYFMRDVAMDNVATYASTEDYLKFGGKEEVEALMSKYEKCEIVAGYKIKSAKSSKDLKSFKVRHGLDRIEKDGFEYLKEVLGKDVEDYYGVVAKIDISYDATKFGSEKDKDELAAIMVKSDEAIESETVRTQEEARKAVDRLFENYDKDISFLMYKMDGKWYVYTANIIRQGLWGIIEFEDAE